MNQIFWSIKYCCLFRRHRNVQFRKTGFVENFQRFVQLIITLFSVSYHRRFFPRQARFICFKLMIQRNDGRSKFNRKLIHSFIGRKFFYLLIHDGRETSWVYLIRCTDGWMKHSMWSNRQLKTHTHKANYQTAAFATIHRLRLSSVVLLLLSPPPSSSSQKQSPKRSGEVRTSSSLVVASFLQKANHNEIEIEFAAHTRIYCANF